MTPDPRFRDSLPYPVAVPYALVFDLTLSAAERRWARCFTQYQSLRLITLALAGQYLRQPIDATAEKAVKSVNECVAALRSPMFSDWVTAVRTLPDRWPALGLADPFPGLRAALDRLKRSKTERSVGLSDRHRLDPHAGSPAPSEPGQAWWPTAADQPDP